MVYKGLNNGVTWPTALLYSENENFLCSARFTPRGKMAPAPPAPVGPPPTPPLLRQTARPLRVMTSPGIRWWVPMGNTSYKRRGRKEPAVQYGGEQPVKLKDRSTRLVTIFFNFCDSCGLSKVENNFQKRQFHNCCNYPAKNQIFQTRPFLLNALVRNKTVAPKNHF